MDHNKHMDSSQSTLRGIWGNPYINLDQYLNLTNSFSELHDEICQGLAEVEPGTAGSNLRSIKWTLTSPENSHYVDAGEVIANFSESEFAAFSAMGDGTQEGALWRFRERKYVDLIDHYLNRCQALYLKFKYGVHFHWSVAYEMTTVEHPGSSTDEHHRVFSPDARKLFPKTIAAVQRLPISRISRCIIYGLDANSYGPVHRDFYEPASEEPKQFILLSPQGNQRSFLWNDGAQKKVPITAQAYWFDDRDYHGVEPDPFFRYTVQIDGLFQSDFLQRLEQDVMAAR